MRISDLLRSGYTFASDEYELETKYVVTNALLFLMSFAYILPVALYYMDDHIERALPYIVAFSVNIFSILFARIMGKDNYQHLVYFSVTLYSFAIFYGYYIEPTAPTTAWVLILIIASFLVTSIYTGLIIALGYLAFLFYFKTLGYHTYEYIVLQMIPILIGLIVIYMFKKKFVNTILLLEESTNTLELKVLKRTQELQIEKESLDYQAHYDFLTKLPNRHKFHKELQKWTEVHRHKSTKFALLFIDLDRFKRVNDSLGHDAGDKVLQVVAARLQKAIPKEAFLSRISGDEFTLILPYLDEKSMVKEMAERLIKLIEEPIVLAEHKLYISASIGISCYPENAVYYADLIKYADTSMFEAKKRGRGTYKFYAQEMTHRVEEMVFMESEIYAALEKNAFVLYFQPQLDSRTELVTGMEILIRWEHESYGVIDADAFIPMAEDTGVIIALDHYVLEKGMQQIVAWRKEGFDLPRISFNFSTKYLQQSDFVAMIKSLLDETACKGEWIELEITESHVMGNIEASIVMIDALKRLGITIAIDDFGVGYSSLTYLKRLPVDKLKIDKSFIQNISTDAVDMTISKAIIDIAKSIGLDVIAEGVETEEQINILAEYGCYHIQGFYYYVALPISMIEKEVLEKTLSA